MPAYSFKATIHNQSASNTLRRVDLQACEGGYTDGWGTPPPVIPPKQDIAFQAESTGPLAGCRGYVKYELGYVRSDGSLLSYGFVCLFWDVPFIGNTSFKLQKAHLAIGCDCDGNMTPDQDESQFAEPFNFDVGAPIGDGVPNDGHGHNNLDVYLVDVAAPGFPSAQPYKYSPFNNPTVGDWAGHWSLSDVDIVIARVGGDTCTVTVKDAGASPPVYFTQTLDLSKPTGALTGKKAVLVNHPGMAEEKDVLAKTSTSPATGSKAASPVIHPGGPAPTAMRDIAGTSQVTQTSPEMIPLVAQNTLHLESGVVLTLMRAVDSAGASQGTSVRYQVISLTGKVSRDLEVTRYAAPPR